MNKSCKSCEPLDLSIRKPGYTVRTPSSYGETSSSLENSPLYSHEKCHFSYFARDVQRSPIQSTEVRSNQSQLQSSVGGNSVPNDSVAYNGKSARRFKAYRKKPICTSLSTLNVSEPVEHFQQFRQEKLKEMENSRGQLLKSNAKRRRKSTPESTDSGSSVKDATYYRMRVKNNAAAKLSRDRRRLKEDETAIKAMFLENANLKLKVELDEARCELFQLKSDLQLAQMQLLVMGCAAENE